MLIAVRPSRAAGRAAATAAAPSSQPAGHSPYLRRTRAARPRPRRRAPIVLGLAAATAVLFAHVWQVTSAHSLAMERDRLRREVHGLENRIRLSSDLAVQEALKEGLDYAALARQGFQSPGPDALIDVDLAQPFPRVVSRQGAMTRLSADVGRFVRGILAPGAEAAARRSPRPPAEPAPDDMHVVAVSAGDAP